MAETTTLLHRAGTRWAVALEWKPQDLWVGVFFRTGQEMTHRTLDLWICILPMLPIHISLRTTKVEGW